MYNSVNQHNYGKNGENQKTGRRENGHLILTPVLNPACPVPRIPIYRGIEANGPDRSGFINLSESRFIGEERNVYNSVNQYMVNSKIKRHFRPSVGSIPPINRDKLIIGAGRCGF